MTTLEHLLYHLRASGPSDCYGIEQYLRMQAQAVNPLNSWAVTELTIQTALSRGFIEIYGEPDPEIYPPYDITPNGIAYIQMMESL